MNVMSSPGSGKTTTIVGTIERLRKHFNIGVMEADIDSDVDALTVAKAGVSAVQLHTGGMCHLDADMSRQGMAALEAEADNALDFIILENVGNLVLFRSSERRRSQDHGETGKRRNPAGDDIGCL